MTPIAERNHGVTRILLPAVQQTARNHVVFTRMATKCSVRYLSRTRSFSFVSDESSCEVAGEGE